MVYDKLDFFCVVVVVKNIVMDVDLFIMEIEFFCMVKDELKSVELVVCLY